MAETRILSLSRLRERAEQCRYLASQAHSDGIATELEKLACDYDEDAKRVESRGCGVAIASNAIIMS